MLEHAVFQRLYSEIENGISQCKQNCQYFSLCGGGAPANKFYEHGSFATDQTFFCQLSIQAMVDIVLEDMESMLDQGIPPLTYPYRDSFQKRLE